MLGTVKDKVEKTEPKQVFDACKKGLKKSGTYWKYRSQCHSDISQGQMETATKLMVCTEGLVLSRK